MPSDKDNGTESESIAATDDHLDTENAVEDEADSVTEDDGVAEVDTEEVDAEEVDAEAVDTEEVDTEEVDAEEEVAEAVDTEEVVAEPDSKVDAAASDADDEDGPDEFDEDDEENAAASMGRDESIQALYALLFASDRPMSPTRLAEALSEDMDPEIVSMLLTELQEDLNKQEALPYFLKEIGGGYQLMTKALYAPFIRRLYQIKKSKRLSKAVLETLAIIAYKQPTTRAEVEAIRGVSVSHAFEQLQERRFIKVSGVADLPGRPKLFRTTEDFLLQFGLGSLKELPTLEELQETR